MSKSHSSERLLVPLVLGFVALLVAFFSYRVSLLSNVSDAVPVVALHVDLERGLSWFPPETLKFPPRRLDLTCYLPATSNSNEYTVTLGTQEGNTLLDAGRYTPIQARFGRALRIQLDLRKTAQGTYALVLAPPAGPTLRYPLRVLN